MPSSLPGVVALLGGAMALGAQELSVEHAECVFFGAQHDRFAFTGLRAPAEPRYPLGDLTARVTVKLGGEGKRAAAEPSGTIDRYIFAALKDAGVSPAARTTDYEFLRRVSLDLTGRIPTPERAAAFAADSAADKRAKAVAELLARPEWVDKWTMYFGDLFKNVDRNTQVNRYQQGRNAFYKWIHASLTANRSYDRMASDLIAAQGGNSWEQGELNWVVGGAVTGGPVSDTWDQQAANVASTFLGLSNLNCVLCHNGRGHLDTLNLWASRTSRYQAWQLASFFSHTALTRTTVNRAYYWSALDDTPRARVDYPLGSTTGNRPRRTPIGTERNVKPVYPFSGGAPPAGDNYRVALAREVTGDIQFARATVNYLWKEFFGRGLVNPADQFDLARLDADNPPPAPWTLQPSHPRLLEQLARDFVESRFDLKALMAQLVGSQAYQLSSRYEGAWKPAWEPLFARKLVRRLWAEELHDAIAQSSNVLPSYSINLATGETSIPTRINWAMQLPQTRGLPGGAAGALLDAFLRGNRDDDERRGDGSILQSLALKNDPFVMTRIRATGRGATGSLLAQNLSLPDDQLVANLFLAVLSRPPDSSERAAATASLRSGDRTRAAENLLWTLYNKVDFIFNY